MPRHRKSHPFWPEQLSKQPLIEAHDISLSIDGRSILDHVSLAISEGEILTVIGPNGAGKTSLLRILLGLTAPSSGSVSRSPGIRIGYMPQKLRINETLPLSVERFLLLAHRDRTAIRAAAAETGVAGILTQPLAAVSGGEFQRILLARALVRDPDLLVLDEPVQGVDVTGQAELYHLINEVRKRHNCAVLMISHDLHLVMASTDTVVCLNQHVCCAGHPEAVSTDPAFRQLFGSKVTDEIAVYSHHHDHVHGPHGEVIHADHG